MHVTESSSKQPLQEIQHTLGDKIKEKSKSESNSEFSENFLTMLQKNMTLKHHTLVSQTFDFLVEPSSLSNHIQSSPEQSQEIYKPHDTSGNQNDFLSVREFKEYSSTESRYENSKKTSSEVKEEIKDVKDTKENLKLDKKEKGEQTSLKGEENIKKKISEKADQAKPSHNFDDLLLKIKKVSYTEAKKIGHELNAIKNLSDKINTEEIKQSTDIDKKNDKSSDIDKKNDKSSDIDKKNDKSSKFKIRLSHTGKNVAREELQGKQNNTQNNLQSRLPSQDLDQVKKQVNQVSSLKNHQAKNSSMVRSEYSFSQSSNTQNQIQSSRFSKLLQGSGLKNQLNEQFQTMLNRAKILIKDHKNASLNTNLHPKELGTVSLKLNLQDGNLNGLFTVDNEIIQKLIVERMDKILSDLQKDGYQVTSFNVNVRSDHSSKQNSNAGGQNVPNKTSFFDKPIVPRWEGGFAQQEGEIYA